MTFCVVLCYLFERILDGFNHSTGLSIGPLAGCLGRVQKSAALYVADRVTVARTTSPLLACSYAGRNFAPAVSVLNSVWNTQLSQVGCLPFLPWIATSHGLE